MGRKIASGLEWLEREIGAGRKRWFPLNG